MTYQCAFVVPAILPTPPSRLPQRGLLVSPLQVECNVYALFPN